MLPCYHVAEENPCNIKIVEVERERAVEGPKVESKYYAAPLNIKKVNIGTTENPKMVGFEDYWDNQTIERIT